MFPLVLPLFLPFCKSIPEAICWGCDETFKPWPNYRTKLDPTCNIVGCKGLCNNYQEGGGGGGS